MASIPYNTTPPPSQGTFNCPVCNGPMLRKQNRANGTMFWGCNRFPSCRGTRNADGLPTTIGDNVLLSQRLSRLLKAAVLASDDECLTFREDDLSQVDLYELHIDTVSEEGGYVVTVRKKA